MSGNLIPGGAWDAVVVMPPDESGTPRVVRYPVIAWETFGPEGYDRQMEAWVMSPSDGPLFTFEMENWVCFLRAGAEIPPEQVAHGDAVARKLYPGGRGDKR